MIRLLESLCNKISLDKMLRNSKLQLFNVLPLVLLSKNDHIKNNELHWSFIPAELFYPSRKGNFQLIVSHFKLYREKTFSNHLLTQSVIVFFCFSVCCLLKNKKKCSNVRHALQPLESSYVIKCILILPYLTTIDVGSTRSDIARVVVDISLKVKRLKLGDQLHGLVSETG